MGMIDTSRSALLAFQRALAVTSHNIANVNTEGYSRQTVNLQSIGSTNPTDRAAPGGGVEIYSLNRAFDKVLVDSVRHDSATYGQTETFGNLTADIDRLFADSDSGLATQIQTYFSSIQNVSNDPTSIATRQVLLGEADMLTARFREVDGRLDEISNISDARLSQVVGEINSYAQQIAEVNAKIQDSGQNIPNDLLDSRDLLITKLSEKVSVNTVQANDGSTSVFAGNGQALVIGSSAETLSLKQSEYTGDGFRVVMGEAGVGPDITEQMSGGVIGGILKFQEEILRPAQNEIGRMAAVIGDSFNELHREGYDLDGNTGNDLFSFKGPVASSSTSNADSGNSSVSVTFVSSLQDAYDINGDTVTDAADITQLRDNWQASDYELVADGVGGWTLTRLSDNSTVALTANTNIPPTLTAADGFVIDVSGAAGAANDRFLIRPFQSTASDIAVAIDNPREFAAANSIDPVYELEYLGVPTANDWKITRLSDGYSTTITDDGDGVLTATAPDAAATISGLFDEGFEVTLPGAPVIGDKYQIHPFDSSASELVTVVPTPADKSNIIKKNVLNTSGWESYPVSGGIRVGNNENALALAELQTKRLIGNGSSTINDAYNQLVSTVGIQTNQANISMQAQGIMLEQSKLAAESVSGVNLDEEAADLIKYQQAYMAAAKVMAAADQMFKTLMNSLG